MECSQLWVPWIQNYCLNKGRKLKTGAKGAIPNYYRQGCWHYQTIKIELVTFETKNDFLPYVSNIEGFLTTVLD